MADVWIADLSPVDLAAVADLDDPNDPLRVVHAVDDSIVPLPNPVPVSTRQFLASYRPWHGTEVLDALSEAAAILPRDGLQFPDCGTLDEDPIVCHASSGREARPRTPGRARPRGPRTRRGPPHEVRPRTEPPGRLTADGRVYAPCGEGM